ncbi:MAG: HAMP domain-containing histidine kinase [Oscillospiraceae bacterium]|nr:HAMP domain-containing histidine kinase [Oscillospiraceae bacterium]
MSRFKGIYWRTFTVTVGMVALTLVLLGASFFSLTYSYIMSEKRNELRDRAEIIAQITLDAYSKPGAVLTRGEDIRSMLDVAEMMSGTDFLIWIPDEKAFIGTDTSMNNQQIVLPLALGKKLAKGEVYMGVSTLGYYEKPRAVVAVPARSEGWVEIGPVLAIAEPNAMTEMWRAFLGIFGMTAVTVLLIAFVATATTAMQQTKPIRDMATAARKFAEGNFDARVHNTGREDEIGELIESFNAMADSLQKTEQQRREFIANISHELKTPMTTIAGYADGILDGVISPEEERQYLTIISAESRRLARLVRRMLDVSQLQSMDLIKQKTPFDLSESMRRVLVSMEKKITGRGLDVDVDIPEDPVMVLGDNDLLTQVVYNLLENAAKFAAQGSTLFLGLARQGSKAVVTVQNTGQTIPPEELPLLFERFHKSDRSRSEDKDGVGLGLYIVRTILEQHHEKITADSKNGVTTFSFTVQLAAEENPKSV